MRALLDVLADERALVLVFDDLHWSDAASIDLIAALLRRGPEAPVLMALAFRPGQAPERLAAALAAPAVQRIMLEQLSESAAAELVGRPDAGAIYRRAGGNPFYLEQLARVAPGEDTADEDESGGIPAAVMASLAEELGSLAAARASPARTAPPLPASRSSPTLRPQSASSRSTRASPRSTRFWRATCCARRPFRAASGSAIRSCAARSTTRRRPAGGCSPTPAR